MPRKKLDTVRFSVTTPQEVKDALEYLSQQNGRSLAVEGGRLIETALRRAGRLPKADAQSADTPCD